MSIATKEFMFSQTGGGGFGGQETWVGIHAASRMRGTQRVIQWCLIFVLGCLARVCH